MDEKLTDSSDAVRSAAPLRHARSVTFDEPTALEMGGVLPGVTVVYETYGRLNESRSNAVLICHALSGDSHVARHDEDDEPGWWDIAVGPGKAIDTDRYFVICPNILGGCRGTTGPGSVQPATGKPYGCDFPVVTIGDMVQVQRRLIDRLGIDRLLAVTGGSMGGHQVLHWATALPQRVKGAIPIATSPRLTSQALAFDVIGRNAILQDPRYHGGQYYGRGSGPSTGLAIARMLGHVTYLSRQAMKEKFEADRLHPRDVPTVFEKDFSVGSYLGYQGQKFVERFDANSYLTLSMAMDLFDVGSTPQELAASLSASRCRWLVVSFTSDWLFPPDQSRDMVQALARCNRAVSYCNVTSDCGHDAFLLAKDLDRYGELIRAFLATLANGGKPDRQVEDDPYGHDVTSIFHGHRLDYDLIVELIPPASSVLDLGCGEGGLLARLKSRSGHGWLMGVEWDEREIITCVQRGLDVVQADLNRGQLPFADRQFDWAVLSQTLQTIKDVEVVVDELLRVGRAGVVSFPNFAYHKLRTMLADKGHAPETSGLLHHKWYNSPNIRFLSIADFEEFCRQKGIRTQRKIFLDTEAGKQVADDPNLNADLAIFVISR